MNKCFHIPFVKTTHGGDVVIHMPKIIISWELVHHQLPDENTFGERDIIVTYNFGPIMRNWKSFEFVSIFQSEDTRVIRRPYERVLKVSVAQQINLQSMLKERKSRVSVIWEMVVTIWDEICHFHIERNVMRFEKFTACYVQYLTWKWLAYQQWS